MVITATEAASVDRRLRPAMMRLFDSLRQYVRVYTRTPDERLPDHDIVWETHIDHGPERALLDAIKMTPEMWAAAIPEDCIIVPRNPIVGMLGELTAEALAADGANKVADQAARLRYEAEERERRERYGKRS